MLANVQQATIRPVIEGSVAKGALVHTDEYDVYARLAAWGYGHKTVCHARGEYARDEDGDRIPMDVSVGDKVLYSKFAGTEVKYDGGEYLVLSERDLLAIVN